MLNIQTTLSKLNSKHSQITASAPDLNYFTDEVSNYISCQCDYSRVNTIAQHTDGDMLLVGEGFADGSSDTNWGCCYSEVIKISQNGVRDETFPAIRFDDSVYTVAVQPNGKILFGGWFNNFSVDGEITSLVTHKIARFNSDGSFDSAFDNEFSSGDPDWIGNVVNKILPISSDKSILVGRFNNNFPRIVTTGNDAPEDAGFDAIYDVALDSQGRLVAVGHKNNGQHIVRFKWDLVNGDPEPYYMWVIDDTFTSPSFISVNTDCFLKTVAIQDDDKIIVGGIFDTISDTGITTTLYSICRINENGYIDTTLGLDAQGAQNPGLATYIPEGYYDNENYYPPYITKIELLDDGKMIVGGDFNTFGYPGDNPGVRSNISKLNSDGSPDGSFGGAYDFYGNNQYNSAEIDDNSAFPSVNDIYQVSSGDIWVGGYFIKPKRYYVKLNSSGTPGSFGSDYKPSATGINDGGFDLYGDGNFFNTNLTQVYDSIKDDEVNHDLSIPSTHTQMPNEFVCGPGYSKSAYIPKYFDATIEDGTDYFGEGSQYFTSMYPGMFVLAATNIDITQFSITGNIGADCGTSLLADVFSITSGPDNYTVFAKTVEAAQYEAAPTHLIIVPGNSEGITHLYDESSCYDDHGVDGISGKKELYSIIMSKLDGTQMTTSEMRNVAQKFLDTIGQDKEPKSCGSTICNTNIRCLKHNKDLKIGSTLNSCGCSTWKYIDPGTKLKGGVLSGSSKKGAWIPASTVCSQMLYSYPSKVVSAAPVTTTTTAPTTTVAPTTTTVAPTTTTVFPTTTTVAP
jgi:uncharacterized delta-60 repeat protein